jgi:Transcription factor WhiB
MDLADFAGPGTSRASQRRAREIKELVCGRCAVRPDCLADAIARQDYTDTIWGGCTGKERHDLHVAEIERLRTLRRRDGRKRGNAHAAVTE